ncbi:hypothetical protein AQI95_35450 [Streptomyces yokosukanensis]|uniref:DUF7144 domain-containing protein n=1 Tax=Streptomyces yokosukanensis TaxID=67386 RepID=A0A101NVY4_9ACTN|nr:hypothetical protein [Streptomyces yokosukanensis]KUN00068.1 hypothetical protein AQI95_35450 [Streptomyces yokosukanensis]
MTTQPHSAAPSGGYSPPPTRNSPWATGGATFAGVLMLLNGILAIFQGISAIAADDVYARIDHYVYKINLTGWGWILLVLGVIAAFAGWGILSGAAWARVVGIALASLSLLAQFLFLPYSPLWSVIMMAIDVFVIWALAAYEPDTARR